MQEVEKLSLTSDAPGKSLFMLGNEAIARGAIEAGIQVYAAYPGTPSSEISETLIHLSKEAGYYAEWAVNEKVAFEVAWGASMCGVRSMTSMKMVGLNVAHDPLMSATYMGTVGGMVLVNADDPGMWSSQNEQDNRLLAEQAYMPILEPSSAQEAKDMVVDAFRLSEEFNQIFMLRSVTRVAHARSDVKLGEINKNKPKGELVSDPTRFCCLPANARKNRPLLIERLNKIKEFFDTIPYNNLHLVEGAKLGIIASGISYSYTMEALAWLGLEDRVSLLKIGTPHPLPEKLVKQMLTSVPEVLVVEELEPFVENHVKILAQESSIQVKINGKNYLSVRNELSTRKVAEAISQMTGVPLPVDFSEIDRKVGDAASMLPLRPPTLCPGCPHRASFHAINLVARKVKKDLGVRALTGDIGCYSLGLNAPLNAYDTNCCMGGGFGLANGVARAHSGPVIGHMGDSTFFHSGIPPLIDAVFNKTNVTLVVLDNSATAMTGFQPHPGSPANGSDSLKAEDIAQACKVKFVKVVDPFNLKETVKTIEEAVRFEGPAVVVSRRPCAILAQKERKQKGEKTVPYKVNQATCTGCKLCINSLGCPAIILEDDKVVIDPTQCDGCSLCAQVCPSGSIILEGDK